MAIGVTQGVGMGLGFVGGQMQGWAALLDKWAMESAFRNEMGDQAGYRNQAMGVFNSELAQSGAGAAQRQMGQAYADRLGMYNAIDAAPLGFSAKGQSSGSPGRDAASAKMMASQRGNLMKYGDWLQNQKIQNMSTGRQLDQITNFAGGNARVFPYLMYNAQHKYDALAAAGAAIASAGGALSQGKVGGPLGQNQGPPNGGNLPKSGGGSNPGGGVYWGGPGSDDFGIIDQYGNFKPVVPSYY